MQWPKVWRYDRGNQKPYIEGGDTIQWPKVWRYDRGNQKPYIEGGDTIQWPTVWRYDRGNQKPYIEGGDTIQWPKEKGHKDTRTNNDLIDLAQRKYFNPPLLIEVRKVGGHVYVCSGDCLYLCFYGFLEVQSNLTMRSPLLSSHLYQKVTFFFSCHSKFHINSTSFKRSPVL
jgi:hypothetical protein